MKYQYIISGIIVLAFLICPKLIIAQQDSLPSDEIQIIKDFDAQLDDVDKVNIFAPTPELDTTRPVTSYNVSPKFLTLNYDAPKIKPLMIKPEKLPSNYNGFVRAAIGYPISPFVEAGYQHQQDNLVVGGKARYYGAFDWNQLDNQQFMDIDTDVNAEYQFDQGFALGGNLGYDYDRRYFFGYDHDLFTFEPEDIKQYFSTIKAGIDFKNTDQTYNDINYKIASDFYTISDNYTASEFGIFANANVGKYINQKHLIDLSISNDFISNKTDAEYTANILSIKPSFTYHHEKFRVKAGVNTSLIEDGFRIFPDAEVLANIYKNNIAFYVAWEGFADQLSFKDLSDLNPFIISNPTLSQRETNYPHGGFKFEFPKFRIGIESGYRMVKNNSFFINDYSNDEKRFSVVYDDVDYITTNINAEAEIIEGLDLELALNFQNARLDSLSSNYHDDPNLLIKADIAYSQLLNNKLTLGTTVYFGSERSILSSTLSDESLSSYLDLNIYSEYKFNDKFKVFLNLNNLSNQKYQRWNGYQNFGFNTMVGVFYKF